MPDDRKPTSEPVPDVTDVVTGPVGSAHLKDPATSGDIGADVYELPGAERPTEIPDAGEPHPQNATDTPPRTPPRP
jgi:hypothetical protein